MTAPLEEAASRPLTPARADLAAAGGGGPSRRTAARGWALWSGADLAVAAVVLAWVPVVLWLDRGASLGEQRLLGAGTWVLLVALLRRETLLVRAQTAVVVAFATAVELVFAGLLEVYAYRLEGVPSFVPPGHGLVYLAALCLGRSALFRAHERVLVAATVVVGGAWAVHGVLLAERQDALGAFWFACLLGFLRWGRAPLLYVGAFVVVSYLEVLGTALGTWEWDELGPLGIVTMGNPPSGAAGGYGWFDLAAVLAAPALVARWEALRAAAGQARGQALRPSAEADRSEERGRR